MAAYQSLLSRAQGVASTPYQAYGGQLVAGFSPDQQQAFQQTQRLQGVAQPYINTAAGYAATGASPVSPGDISNYTNPWQSQVTAATMANINETNAEQRNALTSNQVASGALGGDRSAVSQAELARQQGLASNQTLAGINSQGFTTALGAAEADKARAGQAAYTFGSLGNEALSTGLTGTSALLGTGGLQQQLSQAQLNVPYQQWQQAQAFPYQQTQWLAGLATGVGSNMGGTSSTTAPPPNPWSTYGGLGLAAAGMFLRRGGRVGYDGGGGVGGMPWGGADSWIPSMGITRGSGAPRPPNAPQQGQTDPLKQANEIMGLAGKRGGGNQGFGNDWSQQTSDYMASDQPVDLGGLGTYDPFGNNAAIGDPTIAGSLYHEGGGVQSSGGRVLDLGPDPNGIYVPRGYDDGGTVSGFGDRFIGVVPPSRTDDDLYSPAYVMGASAPGSFSAPSSTADRRGVFQNYTVPGGLAARAGVTPDAAMPDIWPPLTDEDRARYGTPQASPVIAGDPDAEPYTAPPGGRRAGVYQPGTEEDAGPAGSEAAAQRKGFGLGLLSPAQKAGLMAAGFGMMASRSPFLGQAIGEGGLRGMGAYSGEQQQEMAQEKAKSDIAYRQQHIELESKKLSQAAEQAAAHLKFQGEQLAETRRLHDVTQMQPVKIGADAMGQELYAVRDPKSGQLIPIDPRSGQPISATGAPPMPIPAGTVPPAPQPGGQPPTRQMTTAAGGIGEGGSTGVDSLPPEIAGPPLRRDDSFLQTLDPQVSATVKGLADYQINPASLSIKGGHRERLIGMALRYDPDYDQRLYNASQRAITEFNAGGPQSPAGALTAGNTAILHAAEMSDAIEKMRSQPGFMNWVGSSGIPFVSYYANAFHNRAVQGTPEGAALAEFNTARQRFSEEVTRFYSSTGGTQAERDHAIALLDSAKSLPELRAAIQMDAKLMKDKVAQYQTRLQNAMGPIAWRRALATNPESVLVYQNSKDAFGKIQQRYEAGSQPIGGGTQPAAGGDPLAGARDAIAKGAPREAVIQRLREHGINPSGL